MSDKVLFVDDEPNVLSAISRQLRKHHNLVTAEGGRAGLKALETDGPFAVVVSDMKMPEMSGVQFLSKVSEVSPDSVRMILSGASELSDTIEAVNNGNLFRFLTKPCTSDELIRVVNAALRQYRLVIAERDLLEKTLSGSIDVLTEVLGMANPEAFSRAARIRKHMEKIAGTMNVEKAWEFRIAGLLSQIGCIAIPGATLNKVSRGQELTTAEANMFNDHPRIGGKLLAKIPRLENVAEMVSNQLRLPTDLSAEIDSWSPAQLGAQTIRLVGHYDRLLANGSSSASAVESLRDPDLGFPMSLVDALAATCEEEGEFERASVGVRDLHTAMIFADNVKAGDGLMLARKGQEVTESMITRLRNFSVGVGVVEPLEVLIVRQADPAMV